LRSDSTRRVAALIIASLLLVACGESTVGSKKLFNNLHGGGSALGNEASPSPSPASQASAWSKLSVAAPTSQPQPVRSQTAPPPQAQHFTIAINSDTSNQPQFNPPAARVYTGTIISFVNHDTVARSVVSDTGAFDSGPIAPGATWNYTANTVGTYHYHDGTRPYAVAYFEVVHP